MSFLDELAAARNSRRSDFDCKEILVNVICTELAEGALRIAKRTGTGNACCNVSQLLEKIMEYELLRDGSESYDDVRGYIELHYEYWSGYAKWSSRYSNMDKYGVKSEFERHKADILSSPMRKKAFTEACERNGVSLKRN